MHRQRLAFLSSVRGLRGLTAAYLLTKAGVPATVIEADPVYVGGLSRTVNYKGFRFDIGGHRFFSKSKDVVDLWHEMMPNDLIERSRTSRIFYNGKFYRYPLEPFQALNNLGIVESTRCILLFARKKLFPTTPVVSLHDWVANHFGERLFSIFFKTYTEKVWGLSCDEISAAWASQRIKGLDLWAAIANGLRRSMARVSDSRQDNVIKTLIETFEYPRKGPGMMWEEAARKVEAQGGTVRMEHTLKSLEWTGRDKVWIAGTEDNHGHRGVFRAKHAISSAPLREVMQLVTPEPESRFAEQSLRYRDFITVALIVDQAELFPHNWIYVHERRVKVGRIQNFRSWSPEMVPDQRFSCLGLEYFCFEGDGTWEMPDQQLVELAKKELSEIGLVEKGNIVDACVIRQKKAYPVYDEAYQGAVEAIKADLRENYPTLHVVGRNGMHKYNNQDHAMMTSMLTVMNILSGEDIYDVWNVNEDAEYHEAAGAQAALGSVRLVPDSLRGGTGDRASASRP